jgi:hypothetical protein
MYEGSGNGYTATGCTSACPWAFRIGSVAPSFQFKIGHVVRALESERVVYSASEIPKNADCITHVYFTVGMAMSSAFFVSVKDVWSRD